MKISKTLLLFFTCSLFVVVAQTSFAEKKPSEKGNKNLIIPLVIFIGVSIAAFLIATLVINMLN